MPGVDLSPRYIRSEVDDMFCPLRISHSSAFENIEKYIRKEKETTKDRSRRVEKNDKKQRPYGKELNAEDKEENPKRLRRRK